jgi:hypothetical protein
MRHDKQPPQSRDADRHEALLAFAGKVVESGS